MSRNLLDTLWPGGDLVRPYGSCGDLVQTLHIKPRAQVCACHPVRYSFVPNNKILAQGNSRPYVVVHSLRLQLVLVLVAVSYCWWRLRNAVQPGARLLVNGEVWGGRAYRDRARARIQAIESEL